MHAPQKNPDEKLIAEELPAAVTQMADDKIAELKAQYSATTHAAEVQNAAGTIHAYTETFIEIDLPKMLSQSTNRPEDIAQLFQDRIEQRLAGFYRRVGVSDTTVSDMIGDIRGALDDGPQQSASV